jgi:hypothetical protein
MLEEKGRNMSSKKKGSQRISDETAREKTGKGWEEWHKILEKWGIKDKGHTATAKHLRENYGLTPWWAQAVTSHYEREKGWKE